jgi:hypothetical protein
MKSNGLEKDAEFAFRGDRREQDSLRAAIADRVSKPYPKR